MRFCTFSSCLLVGLTASYSAHSQTSAPSNPQTQVQGTQPVDFTRIRGAEDGDVVVPKSILPLGQKDVSALEVIASFLKTVNGAAWSGMQATGTETYPSGDTSQQSAATLTIQSGDAFRLDIETSEGKRSIRMHGSIGQTLDSKGVNHYLPLATARGGLVAFPKLMIAAFPSEQISVLDQGMVSIDGKPLRRITVEEPVFAGTVPTTYDQVSTSDLYFDPTSNLLIKSVGYIQLTSLDRERYIQAITYSDYRTVDNMLLPFAYSQTLNGQRMWSLQLASVQLKPAVDHSYFQF
jgi:hypothetical protein